MIDDGARYRLVNAVESLVGPQPIRQRLETAAITLAPLRPRDFPVGDQRDGFERIWVALTAVSGSESEGDIAATIRAMDDVAAAEVSEQIVRLLHVALVGVDDEEDLI